MNPGDYMDHMRAEAARQDAERASQQADAEKEATPEELATQRVHGQMDRIIEEARQKGVLTEGPDREMASAYDLDKRTSFNVIRNKEALRDVAYGQLASVVEGLPGLVYEVKFGKVITHDVELNPDEINTLAGDLGKLNA